MPLDLGTRTLLYLVVDSESPSQWSAWGDKIIPLTNTELAALPAGIDTIRVTIEGSQTTIPGIQRTVGGRLEWLIRPLPDPVVTMFAALPGANGWTVPASEVVWRTIGLALLELGVTPAAMVAGYPQLWEACKAEVLADLAA